MEKISNIRTELQEILQIWEDLPGEKLKDMLKYPHVYGLDSLSAEIHNQISFLSIINKTYLNPMQKAFLQTFKERYQPTIVTNNSVKLPALLDISSNCQINMRKSLMNIERILRNSSQDFESTIDGYTRLKNEAIDDVRNMLKTINNH